MDTTLDLQLLSVDDQRILGMPQLDEDLGEAASRGDLSENSEYKFAIEERNLLRARLAQLNSEFEGVQGDGQDREVFDSGEGVFDSLDLVFPLRAVQRQRQLFPEAMAHHALSQRCLIRVCSSVHVGFAGPEHGQHDR